MYNRSNLRTINLFCLFLYFFTGCSNPSFFDRLRPEEKYLGVTLYRAETFPQTFSIAGTTKKLLVAGNKEGFSCFFEYYQIKGGANVSQFLTKDKAWVKQTEGFFLRENSSFVDEENIFESEIVVVDGEYLLYAHFLGNQPHNLKRLFPALFE